MPADVLPPAEAARCPPPASSSSGSSAASARPTATSCAAELLSWRADAWARIAPGSIYQALLPCQRLATATAVVGIALAVVLAALSLFWGVRVCQRENA